MKTLSFVIFGLAVSGCAVAQSELGVARWTATVNVVDENVHPLAGARVSIGYIGSPRPGQVIEDARDLFRTMDGLTDQDGLFVASHVDVSLSLGIDVQESGYYSSHLNYSLLYPENVDPRILAKNRNPELTILLKKVGHPIPMYAKHVDFAMEGFSKTGSGPFTFRKSADYDLMAGDWVAPAGQGEISDITFTVEFSKRSAYDYDYKVVLSFPNTGDGIQEFIRPPLETNSALRSPHQAPANGYSTKLTKENRLRPAQRTESDIDPNRVYFIRVRTILDKSGQVKSANYGKIYGDIESLQFSYYLNPTSTEENIEFDPAQNLLHGLQSFEQVSAP